MKNVLRYMAVCGAMIFTCKVAYEVIRVKVINDLLDDLERFDRKGDR